MSHPPSPASRHLPTAGALQPIPEQGSALSPHGGADAATGQAGPARTVVDRVCSQDPDYEASPARGSKVRPVPEGFIDRNGTEMTITTELLGTIG